MTLGGSRTSHGAQVRHAGRTAAATRRMRLGSPGLLTATSIKFCDASRDRGPICMQCRYWFVSQLFRARRFPSPNPSRDSSGRHFARCGRSRRPRRLSGRARGWVRWIRRRSSGLRDHDARALAVGTVGTVGAVGALSGHCRGTVGALSGHCRKSLSGYCRACRGLPDRHYV